ncbi:MAG: type II toxin-antitoxin system PemK/MazF family toxin [Streptococcaceae bacterium]|jgi:mRNA interferase MazF|nr:type II toxin-antitoxin system PemK/MazF family toxin [Streptococcaceae bacterium]
MFIPKQGDIIWINFDPSKGREIKKRRPALVVSSTLYNQKLKFAMICPITSTIRKESIYYTLKNYKTKGQVVTAQLYSFDLTDKANRQAEFIETMEAIDFVQVSQRIDAYFDFQNFQ